MKQSLFRWPAFLFAGMLVAFSNPAATTAQDGTINTTNPPALPVVTVVASVPTTSETNAAAPGAFTIRRTGGTNASLTVYYRLGGNASNGVDYAAQPDSVVIPEGSSAARVLVTPLADTLVEGTERVELALTQPLVTIAIYPPPPAPYSIGTPGGATVSILDGNSPPPTNHPPSVALASPANNARFTAPANITVNVNAYDPDPGGFVATVEYFSGTNLLHTATNNPDVQTLNANGFAPPFVFAWSNVPVGEYTLTARATDNQGASSVSAPVRIVVTTATNTLPVISVTASDPSASENFSSPPGGTNSDIALGAPIVLDTGTFTVRRASSASTPLTVYYRLEGTASSGADYAALPGTVTIPAGALSANVVIVPVDDSLVEDTESVGLILTLPPITTAGTPISTPYTLGSPSSAVVTIADNDLGPVTNRSPSVAIVSPGNGAKFIAPANITLMASAYDADGSVSTVEFFEGTNSLGVATNNPLILQPSLSSTGSTAPISPFYFVWTNVPVGEHTLTARATDNSNSVTVSAAVRIAVVTENIQSVVTVTAADAYASEGPLHVTANAIEFNAGIVPTGTVDTATFTLRRTGSTNLPLTVLYSLSGTASTGVDYAAVPDSVVIPAGVRSVNVVITPVDDTLVEGVETVSLAIEPPVCIAVYPPPPDCFYTVGLNSRATASIRDNDFIVTNAPPTVRLISPANNSVFVAPATIRLVAEAWDRDGAVATVEFFEGANSLGVVTNVPRELASVHPFQLVWSNVTAGTYVLTAVAMDNKGASAVSAPSSVTVAATNPAPTVFIYARDGYAVEADTNTAAFRVFRKGDTSADLTVNYATSGTASNGVDYAELPGSVTIPAGTNSADIVVTPVNDGVAEGTETVTLALQPAVTNLLLVGSNGRYTSDLRQQATVLIFDQMPAPPPLPGGTNTTKTVWRLNGPPAPGADGTILVSGQNDQTVVIEVSGDLKEWQYLSHGVMINGVLQLNDPDTATAGTRFYRVVAP
ncbi:MAG: hypothetical protein HZA89_07505 [Verrucomicrobia bacterium]|nr:hypothetical protein [Verrucomicrobiota bacterium]